MKNDTIRKTKEYGVAVLAFGVLIFVSMVIDGGEDSEEVSNDIEPGLVYIEKERSIYSEPDPESEVIATLSAGGKLSLSDTLQAWYQVRYGAKYAYIQKYHVKPFTENDHKKLLASLSEESNKKSNSGNRLMAYNMCAEFIRDRLKSPSSAEFQSVWDGKRESVTVLSRNKYRVRSYVDSQNSFGANIRTRFICEIEEQGDNWKLNNLNFLE